MSEEASASVVFEYVAEQLNHGASQDEVVETLVQRGLSEELAEEVVSEVAALRVNAIREAGRSNMAKGALWCIGGLVVTAITYSAAAGGGTYVVTWGAIIFGAVQFFKGLGQSNQQ